MSNFVDTASIRRMVDEFYGRVRQDPMLGPIFEERIGGRWPAHLDKMVRFWSAALLHQPGYSGNPRAAHATLPIGPEHFERWLDLFAQTLDEVFPPEVAALIHSKSQMMARGLLSARGYGRHHLRMRGQEAS